MPCNCNQNCQRQTNCCSCQQQEEPWTCEEQEAYVKRQCNTCESFQQKPATSTNPPTSTNPSTTTSTTNPPSSTTRPTNPSNNPTDINPRPTTRPKASHAKISSRPNAKVIQPGRFQPSSSTNSKLPPLPKETNILFNDIGLPSEEFGQPVFTTTSPALQEIIDTNEAEDEESEVWFVKATQQPPEEELQPLQFTPSATESIVPTLNSIISVNHPDGQDPDNIPWIDPSGWVPWDGIPFSGDPNNTPEVCAFMRPGQPQALRGLRELFYEVAPFADNKNPTPTEVDNWNIEVLKHARALMGITTPVRADARLFLEAQWATQRKHSTIWDTKYPDSFTCNPGGNTSCLGKAPGPCHIGGVFMDPDNADGHCGESFFPDATDRATEIGNPPFNNNTSNYPELTSYNGRYAKASAIRSVNAGLPWTLKLSEAITAFLCTEGIGGHVSSIINPTTTREEVGIAFVYFGGNNGQIRWKWA